MPNHTGYPVDYMIRLRGDVVVQSAEYRGRLRDYQLRTGRIRFWPQTCYHSDGAVVIKLVLCWARGHQESPHQVRGRLWHLATSPSDPRQAVRTYRKRMQLEQCFKDGKQRFGLNRSTVTTTHRLQSASGGLAALLLACCLLILGECGRRRRQPSDAGSAPGASWAPSTWATNTTSTPQTRHHSS